MRWVGTPLDELVPVWDERGQISSRSGPGPSAIENRFSTSVVENLLSLSDPLQAQLVDLWMVATVGSRTRLILGGIELGSWAGAEFFGV